MREVCKGLGISEQTYYSWLRDLGVQTLFIEPGSRWQNGHNDSFNGTLAEEVLKREIFLTLREAKVLVEQWRREYNTIRPHSSLGYQPPASEAVRPDPAFLNLPVLRGPHPQGHPCHNPGPPPILHSLPHPTTLPQILPTVSAARRVHRVLLGSYPYTMLC